MDGTNKNINDFFFYYWFYNNFYLNIKVSNIRTFLLILRFKLKKNVLQNFFKSFRNQCFVMSWYLILLENPVYGIYPIISLNNQI